MITDPTERLGIEAVRHLLAELGWYLREPERPDYGVDLFAESSAEDGRPTGRLLALQVKSGRSYVGSTGADIAFRPDETHIEYWLGHSLPVVLVLYDPDAQRAYWQAVTAETIESTGKGWLITVPRAQVLSADASGALEALASRQTSLEAQVVDRLRADLTWIEVLAAGGSVRLEAAEWINKTSGRGQITLIAEPAEGGDPIERSYMVFLGLRDYKEALPALFPWALLTEDEDAFMEVDEAFRREYGDAQLRPVREEAGEVVHWRLRLDLNDLGRGVLALEHILEEERVAGRARYQTHSVGPSV